MRLAHMNPDAVDRLPPHDRAAEQAVLGAVLREPDVWPAVQTLVAADSFYFDAHGRIFRAMGELAAASAPIDLVTLFDKLRKDKALDDIGGHGYLAELWETVPTAANYEYHAKLVRDCAAVRSLIHAANEVLRDAYDRVMPADELLAAAERKVMSIADSATANADTIRSLPEVLNSALDRIDQRIAAGGKLAGVATGYPDLDELLGGLRPGELVVVGARPSIGKTALCLNVAVNAATDGVPALMFSLEMPESEIGGRLLAMGSGVPMHRFTRAPSIRPDEASRLAAVASSDGLGGCHIYLDDTSDATAARIAAQTRRAVRRFKVGLVVVDYLQLMRPENPRDNRTQQVGTLALRMKHMARDCGVPVVLLSQLNREVEHRGGAKPRLADLRESGDIEAHADRVMLLHREPNQDEHAEVWPIEVIVAKNRNGPIGDVTLAYRRPVLRFENAVRDWHG